MPYRFEEEQYLWFEVWDVDKGRLDRTPQNFLGQAKITMANIVSAPGRQATLFCFSRKCFVHRVDLDECVETGHAEFDSG
jgi:hypothetical protein